MNEVTLKWLESNNACYEGLTFVTEHNLIGMPETEFVKALMSHKKFGWANWLMARRLDRKGRIRYACFAARLVLDIYEKRYPNDDRVRKAIETAELCIEKNTAKNRAAVADAAANAANAANAAYAATYAAAAKKAARTKILEYGLTLLEK